MAAPSLSLCLANVETSGHQLRIDQGNHTYLQLGRIFQFVHRSVTFITTHGHEAITHHEPFTSLSSSSDNHNSRNGINHFK